MSRIIPALLFAILAGAVALADSQTGRVDASIVFDLTGRWEGSPLGWGTVNLVCSGDVFQGTYTATFSRDVGRLRLWFTGRPGVLEGVWWEGRYRSGRLSARMESTEIIEGFYSADSTCELNPGVPAKEAFWWTRVADTPRRP
jgi:hypothetical protein